MLNPAPDLVRAALGPEEKRQKRPRPCQYPREQFRTKAPCRDPFATEPRAQIGKGVSALSP